MYLSESESQGRVAELIDDFKSGFEIQPISKDAVMFVCANSKAAMLKRPNGESALFLQNLEKEEELMLDISFFMPEGKTEFEVI